jgi:endo-cleaving rubber dioxygenase
MEKTTMPHRPQTGCSTTFRRNLGKKILSTAVCALAIHANAFVFDDDPNALLGSSHGGTWQWDYCHYKSDDTPVPQDPRTLVTPGVNQGKAVHFNAHWVECHVDPEAVQEHAHPETCGELRAQFERGEALMDTGGEGVAALFVGTSYHDPASGWGAATFSAQQYNMLWTIWGGYLSRPANFDELVTNRYGSGISEGRNPYPLPGEDPNQTDGGSGQLPEMFTQLREPDGSWSGRIGVTCHGCHSGEVGSKDDAPDLGFQFGGSSATDLNLFLRDMGPLGYMASAVTPLNLTKTRGTNNASAVNIAFLFPMEGYPTPMGFMDIAASGSTGSMDSPNWWNMGHRPVKFVDGLFSMDTPRVDSVFYTPFFGLFGGSSGPLGETGATWMRTNGPDLNRWVESLKAPKYPLPVDTALAEQGAVLFHELNMWAPERNNPVRKPEGNGSCAGCHGAYSPRYVNDPNYLDSPLLEGMASYIVPLDIIGTDERRVLTNTEGMQQAGADNFFGYPPTKGTSQDCGPQNQERLRGDRELGYLAQPLYGVWASAPYFHNGSVPNVWEVLKPQDRYPIWRRKSAPAPEGSAYSVVMGFDTDLERAYDTQKMGWKYEKIACTVKPPMVEPFYNCDPFNIENTPYPQQMENWWFSNLAGAWNAGYPPIESNFHMENRKIYNSHMYSQDNKGHEFTKVLTDAERYAIIEYLKTL